MSYGPLDVLVLDANAGHGRIMSRMFQALSCRVYAIRTLADLASKPPKRAPDAVFIDIGFAPNGVAHLVQQFAASWPDATLVTLAAKPVRDAGPLSAARDAGAQLFLKKPFRQEQAQEILTEIRAIRAYGERRRHVVVVDDSPNACRTTAELLRAYDLRVTTCLLGEDTFKHLQQTDVDAVLTDMVMPGMSGQEVIRKVRSNWDGVGVVAMSADERAHGPLSEAVRLGADAVVAKPFGAEDILMALGRAFRRPAKEDLVLI